MSGQIEIPFAIGEKVWVAKLKYEKTTQICSECAGTKALTLIKGNGEQVSLDCRTCSSGYDPPSGFETISVFTCEPRQFTCEKVEIYCDEIRYTDALYGNIKSRELFRSLEDCKSKCVELLAERTKYEEESKIRNVASKRKDMAWSVHYLTRKVNDLKKDLQAAEGRLSACRVRNKDKKDE